MNRTINTLRLSAIMVILTFGIGFIISCAPSSFTPVEQKTYTLTKTLQAAKQFRETGLSVAGDFYKQGLLSDDKKEQIIRIANELQRSINLVADALETYYTSNGSDGATTLEQRIIIYQTFYVKFSGLVVPYLIKDRRL